MEWNGRGRGCICICLEHIMVKPSWNFLFKLVHHMFLFTEPGECESDMKL